MWQRNHDRVPAREALPDRVRERPDPEHPLQRQPADGHDQLGAEELELPAAPVSAEVLLARRRRPVAAPRRRPARVAARHRRTVEALVELVAVEREPAAQGLAGPSAPGQPFLTLDDPRRLAEEIRSLAVEGRANRPRLDLEARLEAGATAGVVALEGGKRAVTALPTRTPGRGGR